MQFLGLYVSYLSTLEYLKDQNRFATIYGNLEKEITETIKTYRDLQVQSLHFFSQMNT